MNEAHESKVVNLRLDDIIPNRFQPREVFDETGLQELAESIKEHGVIQPIIVRQLGDKYELIAGERRTKASALAGLTTIPGIIRDMDDKESAKVSLLENLQRKNLSAIEEARTYKRILELDNMTQEDLARTMGRSQPMVANKLRLLSLPEEVQEALMKNQISERHARSLLTLKNKKDQLSFLDRIKNERLTVRELDSEIKKFKENNDSMELDNEEKNDERSFMNTNRGNFGGMGLNDYQSGVNKNMFNNIPNNFNNQNNNQINYNNFDDIKETTNDNNQMNDYFSNINQNNFNNGLNQNGTLGSMFDNYNNEPEKYQTNNNDNSNLFVSHIREDNLPKVENQFLPNFDNFNNDTDDDDNGSREALNNFNQNNSFNDFNNQNMYNDFEMNNTNYTNNDFNNGLNNGYQDNYNQNGMINNSFNMNNGMNQNNEINSNVGFSNGFNNNYNQNNFNPNMNSMDNNFNMMNSSLNGNYFKNDLNNNYNNNQSDMMNNSFNMNNGMNQNINQMNNGFEMNNNYNQNSYNDQPNYSNNSMPGTNSNYDMNQTMYQQNQGGMFEQPLNIIDVPKNSQVEEDPSLEQNPSIEQTNKDIFKNDLFQNTTPISSNELEENMDLSNDQTEQNSLFQKNASNLPNDSEENNNLSEEKIANENKNIEGTQEIPQIESDVEVIGENENIETTPKNENSETNNSKNDYINLDPVYTINSTKDAVMELKKTTDRIKQNNIDIDTEEIDFDDVYQITIKIKKTDTI